MMSILLSYHIPWTIYTITDRSLFLIEFEKLQSESLGDPIDSFLVLALAFEEECEVGDEQHAAEECEEDPEGRKGDYVHEQDDEPEDYGDELAYPEDEDI